MWVLALAISGNAASNLSQIAQATFCISGSAGPLFGSPRFRCCAPQVPFLVRPGFDFDAPRFWISGTIFNPKNRTRSGTHYWDLHDEMLGKPAFRARPMLLCGPVLGTENCHLKSKKSDPKIKKIWP